MIISYPGGGRKRGRGRWRAGGTCRPSSSSGRSLGMLLYLSFVSG